MVKYRSKIGWFLVLVLLVMIGAVVYVLLKEPMGMGAVVLLLATLFMVYFLLTTYYEIGDGVLRIKSGFLINRTILITNIKKIEATNRPVGAPAASLDRLEVYYNKYQSIILSPKKKRMFVGHLIRLNPKIQDNTGL